eukprot:TRINITY_DN1016_c0_g1_i3.p2 TRINITY_DN1016_c0_g1~~TRINITY_DN1016_c0_g1_i3.p2  ORF type:complete len:243 (-),score=26.04 TRINITY_DN1016_c0_g1_i3:185-814(-)
MSTSLFLLLSVLCTCSFAWEKPWFCHGLDCPQYTVVSKNDSYELRSYPSLTWVSTIEKGLSYDQAETEGFMRLFNYISGANAKKENIPMTAPVRSRLEPGPGPFCKDNFTTSFFVPYDLQDTAPEPSSSDVFIEKDSPKSFYVASFGGYAPEKTVLEHVKSLGDSLEAAGIKDFARDYFYMAGYDPPFRVFDRHNEVWLEQLPEVAEMK